MTLAAIEFVYAQRDQPIAVEIEAEIVARSKADRTEIGGDGAGIANPRRHQGGKAAILRGDRPQIDNRRVRPARNVELITPRHEVGVADIIGGGEETAGIDLGAGTEQDPVRVDQEDAAIGRQGAIEKRSTEIAGDPVECDRGCTRLHKFSGFSAPYIKRLPVDDCLIG